MESWMQSVLHFGNLLRRESPPITPTPDHFDILQFLRPVYEPERSEDFKVLLNVSLLKPDELIAEVVDGKILEIRASHKRRLNTDGFWMTRDLKYTFEIPEKSQGKELKAIWSEDEFLLIEENPGECEEAIMDRVRLYPEQVKFNTRPPVELRTVRDLVEDIRDKASDALRYIVTHMGKNPGKEKIQVLDELYAQAASVDKTSQTVDEEMEYDQNSCPNSSGGSKESPPLFYCA